jgi:hypothetical protein
MALQDWKKLKPLSSFGGLNRYESKDMTKRIYITSNGFSVERINPRPQIILISKDTKTKSEALAYAKAYMRTH